MERAFQTVAVQAEATGWDGNNGPDALIKLARVNLNGMIADEIGPQRSTA